MNPIKVARHSLWSILGCVSCGVSMWKHVVQHKTTNKRVKVKGLSTRSNVTYRDTALQTGQTLLSQCALILSNLCKKKYFLTFREFLELNVRIVLRDENL
jgi:hypothetical protein